MPIKSKSIKVPEEFEPNCPKCGGASRNTTPQGLNEDLFQCSVCGLVFEAVIDLSWVETGGNQ